MVYKLTYFDFMGVGEPIRYMFAYGGINYDDNVINHKSEWPKLKNTVPFAKLPFLEVDGKVLYQPQTIARYVAKKLNLYSTDEWTMAQMDTIVESLYYFWDKVAEWHRETDVARKNYYKKVLESEYCPVYLSQFEKMVESNNGFFVGKLTWVDICFLGIMESMMGMWGSDFLKGKYINLYTLYQKVQALPNIKTYVASRTKHDF